MILLLTILGLFIAALLIGYICGVHACRMSDLIDIFDRREKEDESL